MGTVVVVGSLNCDFVVRLARRPSVGETVFGTSFDTFVGGKGNNQAIAAARAGADVHMVGRVGNDPFAELIRRSLHQAGVHCEHVQEDGTIGTGIADIQIDEAGGNTVIVVPRANGRLSPADVTNAGKVIDRAAVVLLQLEVPIETVTAAATRAKAAGARVVLNPAPAPPNGVLPPALLAAVDIIVPNETEAQALTGIAVTTEADARAAVRKLRAMGPSKVIITLGERGALYGDGEREELVPTFDVQVVDTTAAGDAFCGALAARLAEGEPLDTAMVWASAAGALACTVLGAEPSLPSRDAIKMLVATVGTAG